MASSCSSSLLSSRSVLFISVLIIFSLAPLSQSRKTPSLPELRGLQSRVVNGTLDFSLLWYGRFRSSQKDRIRDFIESLNYDSKEGLDPKLASWWGVVESYQIAGKNGGGVAPRIPVKIRRSYADEEMKYGKELDTKCVEKLVKTAAGETKSDVVPVIMLSWDVKVDGFCNQTCHLHSLSEEEQRPYIVVSDPEVQCPGTCAWPFHTADVGPHGMTYQPPSGDLGADAMVLQLATALVEFATDPNLTGFFFKPQPHSHGDGPVVDAAAACTGVFGSEAFPGFTGKIRIDPATGGAFNSHGIRHLKFLVPSVWNPKTSSCWTPM